MPKREPLPPDFDSPWKEALDQFLEAFLAFFFPQIHADLDWKRGYESLDKEFQQIIRAAKVGRRLADKLFKVWQQDGQEQWLLIHMEVQGGYESTFAERMFVYNVRAFQLYNRMVVSLAVLADESPAWRPDRFEYGRWGSTTGIHFPVVKLVDYSQNSEALEQDANPFAAVVLAHLKARETQDQPATRSQWKLRLVKGLYERKWSAEQIRQLFRLIDWIMALPAELEEEFRVAVYDYEKEKHMPYVTSIERLAKEEGFKEGLQKGITLAVEAQFGQAGKKLAPRIKSIQDLQVLFALERAIRNGQSLAEVRKVLE
jgi:hypothetical protein